MRQFSLLAASVVYKRHVGTCVGWLGHGAVVETWVRRLGHGGGGWDMGAVVGTWVRWLGHWCGCWDMGAVAGLPLIPISEPTRSY